MTALAPKRSTSWWRLLALVGLVWGSLQAVQWWQEWGQAQRLEQTLQQHPVQAGDITMYTTSTCPYCAKARAWLGKYQIPHTECNVEQDVRCQADFAQQGSPGVPLMKVRGKWGLGFDPHWLTLALQASAIAPHGQTDKPNSVQSPRP